MISRTLPPALYRAQQFFRALKVTLPKWAGGEPKELTATEVALSKTWLVTPAQLHLFKRMPVNDQRHALAVVRTLQGVGQHNFALLQAALLHDVGKSLGQPLMHRVLIVLLNAFWPGALVKLAQLVDDKRVEEVVAWRRPFVIHAQHPAIGAEWATAAGCDPLTVRLIARHQEVLAQNPASIEENLLAALQWADDLN
jgi:hypothetical protein